MHGAFPPTSSAAIMHGNALFPWNNKQLKAPGEITRLSIFFIASNAGPLEINMDFLCLEALKTKTVQTEERLTIRNNSKMNSQCGKNKKQAVKVSIKKRQLVVKGNNYNLLACCFSFNRKVMNAFKVPRQTSLFFIRPDSLQHNSK